MRILCVDDDEDVRLLFHYVFEKEHEVTVVASGAEAVPILDRGSVDVLVTDQRMPGMTGLELLEHARTVTPRTRRVLATAYRDDEVVRQHTDGCVQAYLDKPFDRAELAAAISVVDLAEGTVDAARAARACDAAQATTKLINAFEERMERCRPATETTPLTIRSSIVSTD
jgi:CheY-like chemotaxis protein